MDKNFETKKMSVSVPNQVEIYEENKFLTRPPELLILDLYDGCLNFLNKAIEGFKEESYEAIHNNLIKAENIIDELRINLDFENGGEIAKNLDQLYIFINRKITEGNMKKNKESIENAKKILEIIRNAWYDGIIKDKV